MEGKQQGRDYLFDNYKALLVLLVVVGHFIELSYKNNEFLYHLKWFIVSFHMPAFIFISGYFSKRRLSPAKLVQKLVIPYIVYEVIYYLLYSCVIGKPTGLYLLYPKFSLWYLQSLFFWRLITPYVARLRFHMGLSVIAGLLIGCSQMPDNFLSIPRTLVFYPFFLAGIHFNRETFAKLRTKRHTVLAAAGICAFTGYLVFDAFHKEYSPKIFYGRYNYEYLGQGMAEGMLCRLICYGIGFGMTFAVLLLMSERKRFCSYIGTRTMAVYLFHGLIYSVLKGTTDILREVSTLGEAALLVAFCAVLTGILSAEPLTVFTNKVSALSGRQAADFFIRIFSQYHVTEMDLVFGK